MFQIMFRYSVDIPELGKVTVKISMSEVIEKRLKQYFSTNYYLQSFQNNDRHFPLIGTKSVKQKWKISPEDYRKMFLHELNDFIYQLKFIMYVVNI